jgi:hypothetical protein
MGSGEATHVGQPPLQPHLRITPETKLLAPPPRPEAAARVGLHRPRSSPTVMRDHEHQGNTTCSCSTTCPSAPPPCAFHVPPSHADAPSRTVDAQASGPRGEGTCRTRNLASVRAGTGFARPRPLMEAWAEGRRPAALGLGPSGVARAGPTP